MMANVSMQPNAKETLSSEKIKQIAQLESEIESRRAEIDRIRIDAVGGRQVVDKYVVENRDESNEPATQFEPDLREESFGEILVLWEQPAAENRGGVKKIAISRGKSAIADGTPRRSTDLDTPPDMVYSSSYESDETSVASTEAASSNPPSPRSTGSLFEHLLRPFSSPANKTESNPPLSPRQTRGLVEHLLLPYSSPRNKSESSTESEELLKGNIQERDQKIQLLEESISSDTRVMRKMKDAIERLSVELLSAKQSQQLFMALGSRSSSLEDEIEELRVENTKLRISSQMLEEEKRRIEVEMGTELELLHLESGWS